MKIVKTLRIALKNAAKILKKGGIVVYPTDTAYGMGADPLNARAVARIYKIKGRRKIKALPLIAASRAMVLKFFRAGKLEQNLMKKYWPGPVSLVLELRIKNQESRIYYSQILKNLRIASLAVRVPHNPIARELSRLLGWPIVSTSANISWASECYSASEVYNQFKSRKYQPDLILDAGKLKKRKPSTIIKIEKGKVVVLRQGPIKI